MSELAAQFGLGLFQDALGSRRQILAAAIDEECEHRKRGTARFAFPPPAPFGGALQRSSDLSRVGPGEDAALRIERATFAHEPPRPSFASALRCGFPAGPAGFREVLAAMPGSFLVVGGITHYLAFLFGPAARGMAGQSGSS
jgi:hypothetical protein